MIVAPNWGFDLNDDVYKLTRVNGDSDNWKEMYEKWINVFPGPFNRSAETHGVEAFYTFAHGANEKNVGVFKQNLVFGDPSQTKRMLGLPGARMFFGRKMKPFEWRYEPVKIAERSGTVYLATGPNMYIGDRHGRGIGIFGHSVPLGFLSQRLPQLASNGSLQGGMVFLVDRDSGVLVACSNDTGFDTTTFLDTRYRSKSVAWNPSNTTNELVNLVSRHVAPDHDWWAVKDGTKHVLNVAGEQMYVTTFLFNNNRGLEFVGVFAVREGHFFDELDTSVMWGQGISVMVNVLISGAALCYTALKASRQYRKMAALNDEKEKQTMARISKACDQATIIFFPMYLISLKDFETLGALISHEDAFAAHHLIAFSTFEQALWWFGEDIERKAVFFSHQWLGWSAWDPANQHYSAMLRAALQIAQQEQVPKDKFYIWVDCMSIPQACRWTQTMAIASLTSYCTLCSFFCVIANSVEHSDSHELCNLETYLSRGWCRLEQFARLISHDGTDKMFKFTDENLQEYDLKKGDDLKAALLVQEGTFTCCQRGHPDGEDKCDKHKVVDTQIGLYNMFLQKRHYLRRNSLRATTNTSSHQIHTFIKLDQDAIFPKAYFGDLIEKVETNPCCSEALNQLSCTQKISSWDLISSDALTQSSPSQRLSANECSL